MRDAQKPANRTFHRQSFRTFIALRIGVAIARQGASSKRIRSSVPCLPNVIELPNHLAFWCVEDAPYVLTRYQSACTSHHRCLPAQVAKQASPTNKPHQADRQVAPNLLPFDRYRRVAAPRRRR